jgi:phage shock protein E
VKRASATPSFRGKPVDLVVDVRSKLEYWMGHMPGAVCIAGDQLPDAIADRPGINRASRILVYCASGARSAAAAEQLRAAGYHNVVDGGGMATVYRDFKP